MRKYRPVTTTLLPKIDYHDAKHAYFIHAGAIHNVVTAPSSIFKQAVLTRMCAWAKHADYGPILSQAETDLHDRWYVLCGMAEARRGMTLYMSRVEAEQQCSQLGVQDQALALKHSLPVAMVSVQ
jgi:hypothetical protein